MPGKPGSWVSVEEAAKMLNVSPKTIRRYVHDGNLPAYRVHNRLIRIELLALEEFLLARPLGPET